MNADATASGALWHDRYSVVAAPRLSKGHQLLLGRQIPNRRTRDGTG